MDIRKTLVIGASNKPERYSYKAIKMLREYGHSVIGLSNNAGSIDDLEFKLEYPENEAIDTVTLYVRPDLQADFIKKIIQTHPRRVIFNPGTENPDVYESLALAGISTVEACTLVMLRTQQY